MHEFKEKMGMKHGQHHWHTPTIGDCDSKNLKDGDVCSVDRPGRCIPSGKCPIFHGELVCQPNDAHPPKFVTEACDGKKEGDDCQMMIMSGKCVKPKYMNDMFCKVSWPHFGQHEKHEKKEDSTYNEMDDKPTMIVV